MQKYFDVFGELVELLKKNQNEQSEITDSNLENYINKMDSIANADTKLKPQLKEHKFYKNTISSLYRKGISSGYKASFYDQIRREKELLEGFCKANKLM